MKSLRIGVALAASLFAGSALADATATYRVTITNVTKGMTFTPQLVVGHRSSVQLFELGEPALDELGILAESGDTGPLSGVLQAAGSAVKGVETIQGTIAPGDSASIVIDAPRWNGRLSIAAMLIPSNDTFVALNGVRLPRWGSAAYSARAYDSGTELNDQRCVNIPGGGPCVGGEGTSAPDASDEGYVYVSNGIHELGDVDADGEPVIGPLNYDWRNPVARVTVQRLY